MNSFSELSCPHSDFWPIWSGYRARLPSILAGFVVLVNFFLSFSFELDELLVWSSVMGLDALLVCAWR